MTAWHPLPSFVFDRLIIAPHFQPALTSGAAACSAAACFDTLIRTKRETLVNFYNMSRQIFAAIAVILLALASQTAASAQSENKAGPKVHRLAIHVDDDDPARMNLALNNAQNVSVHYSGKGEEVAIEIVAYGPGLHMLRADTSPKNVQARLKSFSESMPNVSFAACENTRAKMAKAEGKKLADIPLVKNAKPVPSGVVHLMELQEQGWSYIRP